MARSLPSLAGFVEAHPSRDKNIFLRWNGLGTPAHGYLVRKKNKRDMPHNWPLALVPMINANLRARGIDPLTPIFDGEAHLPESLILVGHHQYLFPDGTQQEQLRRTRGALMVATNYFDRRLTELVVEEYTRGKTLYMKTNLSTLDGTNALLPSTLNGIPGIAPGHFSVYIYNRHRLAVKISCTTNYGYQCYCKTRARAVLPAMWHVK